MCINRTAYTTSHGPPPCCIAVYTDNPDQMITAFPHSCKYLHGKSF